jgi:hypothetical protein
LLALVILLTLAGDVRDTVASMAPRLVSVVSGVSLLAALLGPTPARAEAPEAAAPESDAADEPDEPDESDPELEEAEAEAEAQALFHAGADRFETADYAGAIELWTRAYGLVPSTPENASVHAKLIANIAAAQERAYAVDGAAAHLKQAKILLERYRETIPTIYPGTIEREKELAWVEQRLASIEVELEAVAEREAAAQAAVVEAKPPPPPGRGLMIAGGVLTGLGVGGLGLMVGGMVLGGRNNGIDDLPSNDLDTRASRFDEGRLGNTLAIAGAVGGVALAGAGVALLVLGVKKKRAAGADDARPEAMLVPIIDGQQAGFGLVGRF